MPIPIDNDKLFKASLAILSNLNISKANGIMAFLALKYDNGQDVPFLDSSKGATSKEVEDLFDKIYRKSDARLGRDDGKVFKILNRKGEQLPTTPNRWRNILATQKGIVCYGPNRKMKNANFLLESFEKCVDRQNRRCINNPQGQDCINVWAKLLQKKRSTGGNTFQFRRSEWSLDLESLLFRDAQGNIQKIPLYPLIVAIYFGSSISSGRSSVSIEDFKTDFHLSRAELRTLFDTVPSNTQNARIFTKLGKRDKDSAKRELKSIEDQSEDYVSPPSRIPTTISRIIRDTSLSCQLKSKYRHRCQICKKQIQKPDGSLYAEAHHIRPLGNPHNGLDILENMIILCPNHHAEYDFGTIAIDPNSNRIIHIDATNPDNGKAIHLINGHRLSRKHLEYHLRNIFRK